jgi:hypothetical protein
MLNKVYFVMIVGIWNLPYYMIPRDSGSFLVTNSVADPGCFSRIRNFPSRIQDQKIPDLES